MDTKNKCADIERADRWVDAFAGILAPILRMSYALAADGKARVHYTTGAADATGSAGIAASVIYMGDIQICKGHEKCITMIDSILDASNNQYAISDCKIAAMKLKIRDEYIKNGGAPFAIHVEGLGCFACGDDISGAMRAARQIITEAGGEYEGRHAEAVRNYSIQQIQHQQQIQHIQNKQHIQQDNVPAINQLNANNLEQHNVPSAKQYARRVGRLERKIALITGAAQGFGKGIAEELAAEGAYVAVADLNYDGAVKCASELAGKYGAGRAIPIAVNVADEDSVEAMVRETVLSYGGLDLFISNAGVLIANSLPDMKKADFDLVTSVNYTGYFLGVKHASAPMKIQRSVCDAYMADIIEINSKSGLEGSNKNFAYAGSKFGGVGLTQSFALELVEYGIKVNAICPGNFLDGPLWSDPEKGLFRQYLDTGKVPGAKTVADVRRYYESRVPMKRGCTVKDVAKAIFYLIEQEYETGQALPVTGGQVMLN